LRAVECIKCSAGNRWSRAVVQMLEGISCLPMGSRPLRGPPAQLFPVHCSFWHTRAITLHSITPFRRSFFKAECNINTSTHQLTQFDSEDLGSSMYPRNAFSAARCKNRRVEVLSTDNNPESLKSVITLQQLNIVWTTELW
jgi:hypothetical protein